MSTRASRSSSRIAMLTGSQDDYTFEIWVSVNGEKLPVLAAKSGKDRVPEGWIASREDESYLLHIVAKRTKSPARGDDSEFRDLGAVIYVDGVQVGSTSVKTREGAAPTIFGGPCASGTEWRRLFFIKPEVTEEETPDLPAGDLASIKVVFERGHFKEKSRVARKDVAPGAEEYAVGPINEDMKKVNMVGTMTELGERMESAHVKAHSVGTYEVHPKDVEKGFYTMKLRYAPTELLVANGIIQSTAGNGTHKASASSRGQKRNSVGEAALASKRTRKAQDRPEVVAVKSTAE